jgi:periplasmic protein TonB
MTMPEINYRDSGANCGEHDPAAGIARTFDEVGLWTELFENLRDTFFPATLAPLELTSTPIPVPDRLANKPNRWAYGSSTVVNGAVLALVLVLSMQAATHPGTKSLPGTPLDLSNFTLIAPASSDSAHGGGGGGTNALTDPVTGRPPKFEQNPVMAPQVPLLAQPKIAVEPAVAVPPNIQMPDNQSMPVIGVQYATKIAMASNGEGSRGGMGIGSDGGLGPGHGHGIGPGMDHGIGGEIYTPGGGVSKPIPIFTPEAEFSDEARRQKYQGVCMISVIIDSHGIPQDPRVVQHLGMGLDEKALEAVSKYRFKPAMKSGRPVAVRIIVEVDFRLF